MDENETIMQLIEDLKDFIIDTGTGCEEQAMSLLKRLNSYKYYLSLD